MEEEYKVIHARIWDPSKSIFKNASKDKAECEIVECCKSDECGLYKRGECSYCAAFGWQSCPYGKPSKEIGFTKRAKKFSEWLDEKKEKYAGVKYLNDHTTKLAIVGDYVFLPYSFMTHNETLPFIAHSGFFRKECCFLPLNSFTVSDIYNIITFKTIAVMGHEITDYQTKSVPKFLHHLKEEFPQLFNSVCEKHPDVKNRLKELSHVGRKAFLTTLDKNVGVFTDSRKDDWTWDGEYLVSPAVKAYPSIIDKYSEIRIKPLENAVVVIKSEDQVNTDTKFAD